MDPLQHHVGNIGPAPFNAAALIQLAPPGPGGVMDYLNCLRQEWLRLGVASHRIEFSKALAAAEPLHARIAACSPGSSGPCSLVLHFSGYGYGERGVCFWLLDEIRTARRAMQGRLRVIVIFHELFASGAPWRSAYWLSQVQALIARRMVGLADALWTNTEHHANWLSRVRAAPTPVHVRPVFSNVGEAAHPPRFGERRRRVVVLGSPSTRQRAFDALRSPDNAALRHLGVEELVEVGPGGVSRGAPASIPLRHAGRLETEPLGALLQDSCFGLLDYPTHHLGKSGVFAAYAAHGCVALNTCVAGPRADGLAAGEHFVALPGLVDATRLHIAAHDTIAGAAARWYADHGLAIQARELLDLAAA